MSQVREEVFNQMSKVALNEMYGRWLIDNIVRRNDSFAFSSSNSETFGYPFISSDESLMDFSRHRLHVLH